MTDPYQALKLRRSATPDAVRRAYRKLALAHHPDRGGSPEDFQRVQLAYELLSDAERRARFDATGQTDAPRPDRELAEVMGLLSGVLASVVEQVVKQGGNLAAEDVVKHMRTILSNHQGELKKRRAEFVKMKAGLATAAARFTRQGEGDNLLATAARAHLSAVEASLAQIDSETVRLAKAVEFLKVYGYRVETVVPAGGWAMTTASTATATWRAA